VYTRVLPHPTLCALLCESDVHYPYTTDGPGPDCHLCSVIWKIQDTGPARTVCGCTRAVVRWEGEEGTNSRSSASHSI
jgi:hypothetical protein